MSLRSAGLLLSASLLAACGRGDNTRATTAAADSGAAPAAGRYTASVSGPLPVARTLSGPARFCRGPEETFGFLFAENALAPGFVVMGAGSALPGPGTYPLADVETQEEGLPTGGGDTLVFLGQFHTPEAAGDAEPFATDRGRLVLTRVTDQLAEGSFTATIYRPDREAEGRLLDEAKGVADRGGQVDVDSLSSRLRAAGLARAGTASGSFRAQFAGTCQGLLYPNVD